MHQDAIVEEIHQTRQALLDQYEGSFEAYFASLLQAQRQHPERYVALVVKPGDPVQRQWK
jgi:hypothetical protein